MSRPTLILALGMARVCRTYMLLAMPGLLTANLARRYGLPWLETVAFVLVLAGLGWFLVGFAVVFRRYTTALKEPGQWRS